MKKLSNFIIEKFRLSKDNLGPHYNYHPKTNKELHQIVRKLIIERGNDADLNDIDIRKIDNLNYLFAKTDPYDIKIDQWDTSHVKSM